MNTTKFVAPNTVFDSSVSFKRNVTFDSSVYLQGVTHISSPELSTADTPYALVVETIGSDVVIKARQLGTMAWESVASWDASLGNLESSINALDILTQVHDASIGLITTDITNLESSVGALDILTQVLDDSVGVLITDVNNLETSVGALDILTQVHDVSIGVLFTNAGDLSTRIYDAEVSIGNLDVLTQVHDASIGVLITDVNNLETSVGNLDLLTQVHDASIGALTISVNDLSTNKLDGVANINVEGDASIFAYELDNIAYLKKIVAGSDIVITEDASTITISGAASTVSKYTDTFDPTGISSYYIPATSTNITDGFATVAVYENNQQVFPDIDVASNGNITIVWAEGALEPTVKVVIMG